MSVLTNFRRKRRSGPMLCAALLAWFGVLFIPCSMAFSTDNLVVEGPTNVGIHADCPNAKPSELLMAADCCCEPNAVMGVKTPELNTIPMLVALPMDLSVGLRTVPNEVMIDPQQPPLHETSPPVYLATQRLRI